MSIRLHNSFFIHIPRTGGLWLGELLAKAGVKHQVLRGDIDSHFNIGELCKYWNKRQKAFAFVRDPFNWVVSRWSHAIQNDLIPNRRHYGVHQLFDMQVHSSLEKTLRSLINHYPKGIYGETLQDMLYHESKKEVLGVDRILRTEEFPSNVIDLLTLWEGIDFSNVELPEKCNSTGPSVVDAVEALPEGIIEEYRQTELYAQAVHDQLTITPTGWDI